LENKKTLKNVKNVTKKRKNVFFTSMKQNTARSTLARPDKIIFRSQQEQSCPTAADKTTPYPHPHLRKLLGKWLFSQFAFFRVFIKNF